MLTHQDIWLALDVLAEKFAMSPSAMARIAGLDPTTFNKSKRTTPENNNGSGGKDRWPSSESLAKVLNSLGVSLEEFGSLTSKSQAARLGVSMGANIPLINMSQAGLEGFFDGQGRPLGEIWDEMRIPDARDDHLFALQVSGSAMSPVFRDGDRIVVSPSGNIKRGDRVVVKTRDGEVLVRTLENLSAERAQLATFNPEQPVRTILLNNIQWMARIIWVSQ